MTDTRSAATAPGPAPSPTPNPSSSALVTAGSLIAAQLVVAASGLLINVLAARSMGPAGRGGLALLLQLAYLVNMLAMAGTDRAYPATVVPRGGVLAATLDAGRLVVPSGAVVLAASVPIVYAVGGGASGPGFLTLVAFVAAASAMITGAVLRTGAAASGAPRPYVVSTVSGQLVLIAVVGVLTARGVASPAVWLLGYALSLSAVPVVAWAMLRPRGSGRGGGEAARDLGPARRLGLRLLPAGLASMVMLRADRLLLPWLGSYEQLGLYVVVATVSELVAWPVQSYVDAHTPRWRQRFLAGEPRMWRPVLGAAGYGLVAGAALLAAGQLLVVPVFGPAYAESVTLLAPLAVAALCYSVSRVAIGLGVATGRARGALLADLPSMVVALVAYLVLIPRYGALGAAVGSAIAYGLGAVLALGCYAAQGRHVPAAWPRRGAGVQAPHRLTLCLRRPSVTGTVRSGWTGPGRTAHFPVSLMVVLFLVALAGRFSFERAGLTGVDIEDPRVPAYGLLLAATLFWRLGQLRSGAGTRWPGVFLVFTLLIAFQVMAALWAPAGARLGKATWDLVALWILVLVATMLAVADPRRAARTVLVLMLATSIVYAVGALVAGPQAQGRYSAFGSGPNVFVRVVSLGVIAAITLAALQRRWWLLLPVPLLAATAVLSGSRGGLVALVGAGMVFFVFLARRRITVLLGTLLIAGVSGWAGSHLAGHWFTTVVENRYSSAGLQRGEYSVRPDFLSSAWRIFLDHPVAGGGLDSFHVATGVDYPHNYLAGLAAETGLVAVLLALLAIVWWCWQGRPWRSAPAEHLGCAMAASYILIASMFSGDHFDTRFFWIFAVVAVLRPQPGTGSRSHRTKMEVARCQKTVRRHAGSSS